MSEIDFGFQRVDLAEKQGLVNDVFHKVAGKYDLMNDAMSFGLHRLWKDAMIDALHISPTRPHKHLDVAGGTGDVAFRVLERGGEKAHVTLFDINGGMLKVGRDRATAKGYDNLEITQGTAESLPFPDKSFDAYTIAFGIRNVPRRDDALKEAYRVLKTGGRLAILEFKPVETPLFDEVYKFFSMNIIPPMGKFITGDAQPYQYLVESIQMFPHPQDFAAQITHAGFSRVGFTEFTGGIVALHTGWKL
jgi:demethylmenaquinone methyltransferase / 2-methoxy-6-polyprenyl-1,4-benzoquinol methylase